MRFEWSVAWRYLRSPHRPAVLRLVTLLAVAGVTAGAATLIIALAMNTGFRRALEDRLLGVTAHVNLSRPGGEGMRDYGALARQLSSVAGVRSVTPALYETVLLTAGGRARGIVLKGVDPELEQRSNEAFHHLIAGTLDFAPDAEGIDGILVGRTLADELKLAAGTYVTLMSPQGRLTPFGMMPRTRRFRVMGVFDSGFYDYDANWGFIALSAAQNLAGVGDVASVLEFRIARLDEAQQIAQSVVARAGTGFKATTWMEENRALFRALRLEKLVTALFIGLITFVAGMNILAVLSMTVTDKARDIAVLMALGARREQVRNIFVWLGLAVGAAGTIAGLFVGYLLAVVAGRYRLIPLDPEVYSVPYVPFAPNLWDALWIAAAALAISGIATILPARAAARLLPVEVLRYE